MSNLLRSTICAVALFSTSSLGALAAETARGPTPPAPTKDFVIKAASVQPMRFAEWDDKGAARIAWDKDVDKAPKTASRYTQKHYAFPTGSIRVLEFKKDAGGVFHQVGTESHFRVQKGSVEADVGGQKVTLKEGDVLQAPKGVIRSGATAEDTTLILWDVTGTVKNPKTQVIRAADARVSLSAEWDDAGGKHMRVSKPEEIEKAPKEALRLTVRRYELEGNSVRAVHSTKGVTGVASGKIDALLYVVRGNAVFVEDGHDYPVSPGDAIREAAGSKHNWKRHEPEFEFVSTSTEAEGGKPSEISAGVREDAR